MKDNFFVRNRQRRCPVNVTELRRIGRFIYRDLIGAEHVDLGIYLVAAPEMTRLNGIYLRHDGSTDVITFDYSEPAANASKNACLHGEIFICMDEAVVQARQFRTSWEKELTRYFIHGLLHLCGYDDRRSSARGRMKREEDRLLQAVADKFALGRLRRAEATRS